MSQNEAIYNYNYREMDVAVDEVREVRVRDRQYYENHPIKTFEK